METRPLFSFSASPTSNAFETPPDRSETAMSITWNLRDDSAQATVGDWQIKVNPTTPNRFATMSRSGLDETWTVFSLCAQPSHTTIADEIYVRDRDLIARFAQAEQDEFAYHVMWRLLEPKQESVFGLELWLSVQTALLDSAPAVEVACNATGHAAWEMHSHSDLSIDESGAPEGAGPAALVSRHAQTTGVWLIEPTDQRHARLQSQAEDALQSVRVFGHFMEKGVIRRARMRFLVFESPLSPKTLAASYADFARSPLPLTA